MRRPAAPQAILGLAVFVQRSGGRSWSGLAVDVVLVLFVGAPLLMAFGKMLILDEDDPG